VLKAGKEKKGTRPRLYAAMGTASMNQYETGGNWHSKIMLDRDAEPHH